MNIDMQLFCILSSLLGITDKHFHSLVLQWPPILMERGTARYLDDISVLIEEQGQLLS